MGGQSSDTTTTTRNEPPAWMVPVMQDALQNVSGTFSNPNTFPQYYPYSTITPQTGYTERGAQYATQGAERQANVGAGATQAAQNVFNSVDVGNDPYLAGAAEAAVRPIYRNLTDVILPSVQDQNIVSGTFGGGRQGVVEAQAIQDTQQQALDTTSLMYANALQNAYGNASRTAIGLPAITAGLGTPAETMFNTGGLMEGYNQRVLDDQVARFAYEQNLPYDMAARYWGMLSGQNPGGSSAVTPPAGRGISPLTGALGGAAAGYSAFPAGGWYSAGAGALLGLLASRQ